MGGVVGEGRARVLKAREGFEPGPEVRQPRLTDRRWLGARLQEISWLQLSGQRYLPRQHQTIAVRNVLYKEALT